MHVTVELQERFVDNPAQDVAVRLMFLLPHECIKLEDDFFPAELHRVVDYYSEDLPHPLLFPIEYESKWTFSHEN